MKTKITFLSFVLLILSSFQLTKAVVFTVEVPAGTHECYMIGVADDWTNFLKMNRVGTENKFTLEIADLTPAAIADKGYSYCSGPEWAYEEIGSDGKGVVHFWQEGVNNVVGTWKAVFDPGVALVYTVNVPAETKVCYMVGDATGGWNTFLPMERVGATNTFKLSINGASKDAWNSYAAGPSWDYEELDAEGKGVARKWTEEDTVLFWKAIQIPSGVDVNTIDFLIKIQDKRVVVENIVGKVSLFNINGQNIQNVIVDGKFESKELSQGIYILQNNGKALKVVI